MSKTKTDSGKPPETPPRAEAKLARLTRAWKKSAAGQLPDGMEAEGIVSGGKGINHRMLIFGGLGFAFGLALVLGGVLKSMGTPGFLILFILIITLNLLPILAAELGVYRSVIFAWDQDRVVILERASFNRLKHRTVISRPLGNRLSWVNDKTVLISGNKIHLDYPALCRDMVNQALGPESAGGDAPETLPETKTDPAAGGWFFCLSGKQKAAYVIANVFIFLGFVSWVGAFSLSIEEVGRLKRLSGICLPVGPAEATPDRSGRVYLISKFYRRIQRFDATGVFQKGWHLSTFKGVHVYAVDRDNRLHIYVGRRDDRTHFYLDEDRGVVRFPENGPAPDFSAPDGGAGAISGLLTSGKIKNHLPRYPTR